MIKKSLKRYLACILSIALFVTGISGLHISYGKAAGDMGGYLWAFFEADGGYEKMFFGYSKDGLTWYKLNKNDEGTAMPLLVNDAPGSDKGVRDPHIIRAHDGSKYWILGTDLHAEGGGSGGSGWNQVSASQNIVVWESEDLINWSEPKLVHCGFNNAGCVWAPEAIYDEENEDYVVYWSARDKSLVNTEKDALRVYVSRTTDFNTFTTPKVWLSEDENSGDEVNIIDTTIVKDGEYYYRFSTSDWNTVIDRSKTLDTDDVFDVTVDRTGSKPNNSWERIVTRSGSGNAGFDSREGFTVYQLPDGKWCAMGDHSGYSAFVTDDLSSARFTNKSALFIDGRFRHGTVMRLTAEEDKVVMEKYGKDITDIDEELDEEESGLPVLEYNFEDKSQSGVIKDVSAVNNTSYNGTLSGNARLSYDNERDSNVLVLDGSSDTYASFPKGFFDLRNTMTICMDVKSNMDSGNFFTFAFGKNNSIYDFLRIRGSEVRNAITVGSYQNEKEVKGTGSGTGEWQNVVIVIDRNTMKLYINGKKVSENQDTGMLVSMLGKGNYGYLGKSFYSGDEYFDGSFDNIKVYNRVLSDNEVIEEAGDYAMLVSGVMVGTAPTRDKALEYRGTDVHSSVFTKIDYNKNSVSSYVRQGTDIKNIPVTFDVLSSEVVIKRNGEVFVNGSNVDLSKSVKFTFEFKDRTEEYTVKHPMTARNSVLPGQYADPDIDYFDGKFWIFPTTDGYPGWSGTLFHAWSSKDLVSWEDEGVIMKLADDNPGVNEKGVQIARSPWAVKGSAWAPTIEKKNGKYYFYYCGKDSNGTSQIGVASADKPAGPYTDLGRPLITVAKCKELKVDMGQAIDPSVFTDDDGSSYITFGNGKAAIVKLGSDMMSIDESSMRQITGLTDFRESVVVIKRNGRYHWTWTCDDANSPNYHVNYGVSDTLNGEIKVVHTPLLKKKESMGILGTGHQSLIHVKDIYDYDRYFIAYHRFYSPLNIFTSGDGLGVHRETCIDEVTFNDDGYMNVVTPSHEGVSVIMKEYDPNETETPQPTNTPQPTDIPKATDTPKPSDIPQATDDPNAPKATDTPASPIATVDPGTVNNSTTNAPGTVTPLPNGSSQQGSQTGVPVASQSPADTSKTVAAPKVKLSAVSSVKKGKKVTIKVKIKNADGSKSSWSLDKKAKKIFRIKNKKKLSLILIAKKKGKGTVIFRYGKIKVFKTIKVK